MDFCMQEFYNKKGFAGWQTPLRILKFVDLGVFFRQVAHVRFRRDGAAGYLLHQHLRLKLGAVLMNLFAQPSQQFVKFALLDLIFEVRDILIDLFP